MSAADRPVVDPLVELEFALAEGHASEVPLEVRSRVIDAALAVRRPGRPSEPVVRLSGTEVFEQTAEHLDALLSGLQPAEWARPALRDLDVQGLAGHLIGVETLFAAAVEAGGDARVDPGDASAEHIASTQPAALAQAGRPADETRRAWREAVRSSLDEVGRAGPDLPVAFYGIVLPLDLLLVVRSFEMWIHEEDIRRATGRPLTAIDPPRLARMVELAVGLVPAGMARAGLLRPGRSARLVLTGPGGGTFTVALDGSTLSGVPAGDTRIVVDATEFCRMVGNRPALSAPILAGDHDLATDLLVGAAALALD